MHKDLYRKVDASLNSCDTFWEQKDTRASIGFFGFPGKMPKRKKVKLSNLCSHCSVIALVSVLRNVCQKQEDKHSK